MPDEATTEIAEDLESPAAAAEIEDEVTVEGIEFPKPAAKAETQNITDSEEKAPPEEKEPAADSIEGRLSKMEKRYNDASTHIERLEKALHQTRQENKALKEGGKKPEADEFLTDEQVKAILEEHGNDWSTVLRVVNHQAAKAANKAKLDTISDVETKQVQERLAGFTKELWPESMQEGNEIYTQVEDLKGKMRLESHPYGDYLARSALMFSNFNNIVKNLEEKIKKEVLAGKVETNRKQVVKKTGLTAPTGADKTTPAGVLPANLNERAKQLGLSKRQKEIYARLVKGGNSAVQMGA
jgi:hypothetical protein